MSRPRGPMWRIFAVPALLAMVSAFGLVAALLSNAPADWLWDACIAAPFVVIVVMLSHGLGRNRPKL